MIEDRNKKRVDYRKVLEELMKKKKLFYIVLPIVFVISSLYIISIPREFVSETKMAPEVDSPTSGNALGSLASSFGVDISAIQSSDAITPILYPELMDDNGFIAGLFDIKVESIDGGIKTNFYTYMKQYQKTPWWNIPIYFVSKIFEKKDTGTSKIEFNPYRPSKKDNDIIESIKKSIVLVVDKKTGIITITVTAQDPFICKTVADSVRGHLQQYITKYRTNKVRIDYNYYKKITAESKQEYERARQLYGSYSDANTDIVLPSFRSKQEDLENYMQLKFNAYSTLNTQLQAAKAKVQERTPAFTLIKGSTVPILAARPQRVLFVFVMTMLSFIIVSLYILRDIIISKTFNNER